MKLNPEQKATMYAAFKELERILKADGNDVLPIGEYDVSGKTVTVTLPSMTVERDGGARGDGIVDKTATQNLYGWGVIAALADRLKRFNQWETVRHLLVEAVREVLSSTGKTVTGELSEIDATFAAQVAQVRLELAPPTRPENTPRKLNRVKPRQLARVKIED